MLELLIFGIVIILFALVAMLFSRSQSLQRFAVMEFLLLFAVLTISAVGVNRAQGFMKNQYINLLKVYISEAQTFAFDLETYGTQEGETSWETSADELQMILEASLPVTTIEGQKTKFLSAGIFERVSEGQYAERGYRFGAAEHMSEAECRSYIEKLTDRAIVSGEAVFAETEDGTGVFVYTGKGVVAPRYVLLTEISLAPLAFERQQLQKDYVFNGVVCLMLGTLLLVVVIWLQGRHMRRLVKVISRVASGKEDWETLKEGISSSFFESNEMRALKNSLGQISTDVARMNYMKYRVLQGYYRFAPKQIEKILGKTSILEVEPNDRIHLTGTLAFVSYPENKNLSESEYLYQMSMRYEMLGEKQKEYEGIILSDNSDLTTLQLLFREETMKALSFGVEMIMTSEENKKDTPFVMLHRTSFIYGVAGDSEQAFSYVLSKEMKLLEKYVESFRAIGIRMVVTDSVYEVIEKETTGRYIGFLEAGGFSFKLYEILDACPAKERKRRLDTREKFQKALNLFYQGDYYLGRNQFTEVLKESPQDEVAKRYLFLCEQCLNTDYGNHSSCALFSE